VIYTTLTTEIISFTLERLKGHHYSSRDLYKRSRITPWLLANSYSFLSQKFFVAKIAKHSHKLRHSFIKTRRRFASELSQITNTNVRYIFMLETYLIGSIVFSDQNIKTTIFVASDCELKTEGK